MGTVINIEHRAASGIGARVKAEAVLELFDDRFYILRTRAVISVGKFMAKFQGGSQ